MLNVIRIGDAKRIMAKAIENCFGGFVHVEEYFYEGDYFESYEITNNMSQGALKCAVNDSGVEFRLDGHTIMSWTTSSISEIDEQKIAKHMRGYNIVDLYIDFFNEVKRLIEFPTPRNMEK